MEAFTNLFAWIAANIERSIEQNDNDPSLMPFFALEFKRWGFIGETVNGIAFVRPAKIVTANGLVEVF